MIVVLLLGVKMGSIRYSHDNVLNVEQIDDKKKKQFLPNLNPWVVYSVFLNRKFLNWISICFFVLQCDWLHYSKLAGEGPLAWAKYIDT